MAGPLRRLRVSVAGLFLFLALVCFGAPAHAELPDLTGQSVILIDADTGTVLGEKAAREKRAIGSTTKIVTAILALEKRSLEDLVSTSESAPLAGGSEVGLGMGDQLTVRDLLYSLMVASANDAAVVLAENIGESVPSFAQMMNDKAEQIGAKDSNFVNPHGLHDPNHYSTAADLSLMAQYAMKNKVFREIVATKERPIALPGAAAPRTMTNRNRLLWLYEPAIGIKTGFVKEAGYCLVAAAEKNGLTLISVVLGAPTKAASNEDSVKAFTYGFDSYARKQFIRKGRTYGRIKIPFSRGKKLAVVAERSFSFLEGEGISLRRLTRVQKGLDLPVKKGEKLGSVSVWRDKTRLAEVDLVAERSLAAPSFGERVLAFLRAIFSGA
ncbi:MAG: D-alanyl-D-alanine carboxypeptidase family protein [Terriglobia bacterium]